MDFSWVPRALGYVLTYFRETPILKQLGVGVILIFLAFAGSFTFVWVTKPEMIKEIAVAVAARSPASPSVPDTPKEDADKKEVSTFDMDHTSASTRQNYKQSLLIRPILQMGLEASTASSVGLVRYHNGQVGSLGYSFARKSMTDVMVNPGVANPTENVQNLQATADFAQLDAHVKKKCRYDNIDKSTAFYGQYLKNGNKAIFTCPIMVNGLYNPMGYIAFMYQIPPLKGEDDDGYSSKELIKREHMEKEYRLYAQMIAKVIEDDHTIVPPAK